MRADNKNRISKCSLSYKLLKMPWCQGISGIAIVQIANLLLWHNSEKRDFLFKPSWRGVSIIRAVERSSRKSKALCKDKYRVHSLVRGNKIRFPTKHRAVHGCARVKFLCPISHACLIIWFWNDRKRLSEFFRFGWRAHKAISDMVAGNFCAQRSLWAEFTPANICGESMICGIDSRTNSPKCYKVFARANCNVFIAYNCCILFNN